MTADPGKIGFVGLGAMGTPIVEALVEAGHELVVYDREPAAVERAVVLGAVAASSVGAVADVAEIVFVSLPKPDVVREVATGAEGLIEGRAIRAYVDLSTTGAVVAGAVAAALSERGIEVLDAPVSGGIAGAKARTLAVMASGDEALFERTRPLLETFATNVFLVGATSGQGQTAKLLNNLLSAAAMAITSEAVTFGATAGLDPATLLEVFNASSGRNTATSDKFPKHVLTRRFASGFRLELMAKDVELCVGEARGRRFPMLLGGLVQQLWTLAAAEAERDADHTEIIRLFEGWAGLEIGAHESTGP
jgi:3-hydroxyisobutyrate dehydrogenase-like beta-hydroxyacid dehydrogenase